MVTEPTVPPGQLRHPRTKILHFQANSGRQPSVIPALRQADPDVQPHPQITTLLYCIHPAHLRTTLLLPPSRRTGRNILTTVQKAYHQPSTLPQQNPPHQVCQRMPNKNHHHIH